MIAILDYGMGNLSSVHKAFRYLKSEAVITHSPRILSQAQKIVLPGVGAFGDAMKELKMRKLIRPILDHLQQGKKFLGICLGLQLLFEKSEENRGVKGLGYFKGTIRRFRTKQAKVPHMGWNQIAISQRHALLKGVRSNNFFYFVHSFYAAPNFSNQIALTEHGGEKFASVISDSHAVAVQFHPEKSQDAGLRLLKNFIDWH